MINRELIEEIATRHLEGTPHFLVEVKCPPSNQIEVIIDSEERLSIDDCVKLSKAIESELDRDVEDFQLMVTSAGIGQPFKIERQYLKSVGRTVQIILKTGTKITGTLVAVDKEGVTVEYEVIEKSEDKRRKVTVTKHEAYKFDEIKSTTEELTIR